MKWKKKCKQGNTPLRFACPRKGITLRLMKMGITWYCTFLHPLAKDMKDEINILERFTIFMQLFYFHWSQIGTHFPETCFAFSQLHSGAAAQGAQPTCRSPLLGAPSHTYWPVVEPHLSPAVPLSHFHSLDFVSRAFCVLNYNCIF